jgi:outer membrane murein-binding lipoprotein Lpp
MSRQLLAVVLVAVVAGTLFGFALAGASSPPSADASANSRMVTQLKRLNANVRAVNMKLDTLNANASGANTKLDTLNARIGEGQTTQGTVRGLLTIICDYTASVDCKR